MNKREWTLLFSEYELRLVLDAQLRSLAERVLALPKERFASQSDELLAAQIASDLTIVPIVLDTAEISVSYNDAKVDVSHDRNRMIMDLSQPFYREGVEVTYHVPYRGDQTLLKCRGNAFTYSPPRAVIGNGELRFPYDEPDRNVATTKVWFDEDIATLKQWLPWINESVEQFNSTLEANARGLVAQRRQEICKVDADVASLGFRVRGGEADSRDATDGPELVRKRRFASREKLRRTYDVALSFAGEDREYVERVAERLKALDVSVFYDSYEQASLWGTDLAEHLGKVYGKDSRFVVLFLSRHYASKAWPTHEKRFALGRQLSGVDGRILPVRFDETEIPGLPTTIGYLDLRVLTPEKLAELIRQKVDAQ
jgi:hypothetical protein